MDRPAVEALLARVAAGELTVADAADALRHMPFEELEDLAAVDHHRALRCGIPEVVFGETKSAEQIAEIMRALAERGGGALATRVDPDKAAAVMKVLPAAVHRPEARAILVAPERDSEAVARGLVAIVSAGTSDEPVAMEAAVTLEFLGYGVERIRDVGVAGVHRILRHVQALQRADVVIVVAGMEGALPSVVGGLTARPIVAVPTSVGYGVSVGGFAALIGMLSSCSAGIAVVNIDNGFGAAAAAARLLGSRAS